MRRHAAILLSCVLLLGFVPEPSAADGADTVRVLVTFDGSRGAADLAADLSNTNRGSVLHVYERLFDGAALEVPANALRGLSRAAGVRNVEVDTQMTTSGTQTKPPWGLDRVDQRTLPLDRSYTYESTGQGVNAYIVDTGIRASHTDFGNRVTAGTTYVDDGFGTDDCNGHGTHVAGTVGGATYGVAKAVTLVPVRVFGCTGGAFVSDIVAGLDWIAAQQAATSAPGVVNMSLGGGASSAFDNAVVKLIDAGVTVVVAAGNANADACNYSPARVGAALTVAATTSRDARASYSNYGNCVDVFAPGSGVVSAYYRSDTDSASLSGTSMASPHVAGIAALLLQADPKAPVAEQVIANATADVVSDVKGSPDLLAYSLPVGEANQAPTAAFTATCSDLACTFDGSGSSDPDGTIAAYSWDLGDGTKALGASPSHTYAEGGSYQVELVVTDDLGATGSTTSTVSVTAPSVGGPRLDATVSKQQGRVVVDLAWSGLTSSVDVSRDGSWLATVNGSTYVDRTGQNGSPTFVYEVCAGTACTNQLQVSGDGTVVDLGSGSGGGDATAPGDGGSGDEGSGDEGPGDGGTGDEPVAGDLSLALNGFVETSGPWWRPYVTATVTDAGKPGPSGIVIAGSWTGTTSGSGSCTTDTTGSCTIELGRARVSSGSTTFTTTWNDATVSATIS